MQILINKATDKKQEELELSLSNIEWAKEFFSYAKQLDNCAGLAAPQVGADKNICVIAWEDHNIIAINPKIIWSSEETYDAEEACLSWPGKVILAKRHKEVEVEFFNVTTGEKMSQKYVDFVAEIWQHELDHLNGTQERVVDRDYRTVRNEPGRVGRNDPCTCGSGKKYKKCCGK
jgi:peptide deformylase